MAKKITGQVLGGSPKGDISAETVGGVFKQLGLSGNYTATVNGEPADMETELNDYEQVMFAPSVKGGK